jgi:hypothetical protein
MAAVPLPADARPSADSDAKLVVWQASSDTMWEFWRLRREADGWHAGYGGRIDRVSASDGVVPAPFGASASGLPYLGGLITQREVIAGHIDHALALGVPRTTAGVIVSPATRTDGRTIGAGLPMGTRLRLDPALDLTTLHLTPIAMLIARAAQRYGVIVRDTSGAVSFYGEEQRSGKPLWPMILGGLSPSQALRNFPYARLQVVAPSALPTISSSAARIASTERSCDRSSAARRRPASPSRRRSSGSRASRTKASASRSGRAG